MHEEIAYMLVVIAVGFAVNYSLRALPFLVFAGRDRELPAWVEKFGAFLSPVIIAALIFYSYSGLAWKSAWPYLAGALTVGLQVWKRNPLVSIVAGTVLYMCLLSCGCTTQREIVLNSNHPAVVVTETGVTMEGEPVEIGEIPDILEDNNVPKERTIHIQTDPSSKAQFTEAKCVMVVLAKAGYRRPIIVTKRHSESVNTGKVKKRK